MKTLQKFVMPHWLQAIMLALIVISSMLPATVNAAPLPDTDQVQNFIVTVEPQSDGKLRISYEFDWLLLEAYTYADDYTIKYSFETPNRFAELEPGSASATDASGLNILKDAQFGDFSEDEYDHVVKFWLTRELNAGDVLKFRFTIIQDKIAYDDGDGYATFQFSPVGFDDFLVNNLQINWKLPDDRSLVIVSNAHREENGYAVWQSSLGYGEQLTATIKYAPAAFPGLQLPKYVPPPPAEEYSGESTPGEQIAGIGILGTCLTILLVLIVVWLVLSLFFALLNSDSGSYSSGTNFGGYTTTTSRRQSNSSGPSFNWSPPSTPRSSPSHSSGFGGNSSGRGLSSSIGSRSTGGGGGRGGRG